MSFIFSASLASAQTMVGVGGTFSTDTVGANGANGSSSAGGAGTGGVQLSASTLTLVIDANITGGNGGNGDGSLNAGGNAGFGFSAGATTDHHLTFNAGKTITGGNGGNGATPGGGNGGAGGSAGNAIGNIGTNSVVFVHSNVVGGNGGNGGDASGVNKNGGLGGTGGFGLRLVQDNITATISGSITGGNGGTGGLSSGFANKNGGLGGSAVYVGTAGTTASVTVQTGAVLTGGNGGLRQLGGLNGGSNNHAGSGILILSPLTNLVIEQGATVQAGSAGSVATAGDAIVASGIQTADGDTITNFTNGGLIRGGSIDGVAYAGMAMDIDESIVNFTNTSTGVIGVSNAAGTAIDYGTAGSSSTSFINQGSILSGSGNGLHMHSGVSVTTLNNTGHITTLTGTGLFLDGGTITNFTNGGTLSASTGSAFKVSAGSTLDSTLTNTNGVISSSNSSATQGSFISSIDMSGKTITGGSVTNSATNGNAFYFDAAQGSAFVLQDVSVTGNLAGGAGAQIYTLAGTSSLNGGVHLGAGANSVTFNADYTGGVANTLTADGGTLDVVIGSARSVVLNAAQALSQNIRDVTVGSGSSLRINENFSSNGVLTNNGTVTIAADTALTTNSMGVGSSGNEWIFGFNPSTGDTGLLNVSSGHVDFTNGLLQIDSSSSSTYMVDGRDFMIADGVGAAVLGQSNGTYLQDNSAQLNFILYSGDQAAVTESGADSSRVYIEVDRLALDSLVTDSRLSSLSQLLDSISTSGGDDIDQLQVRLQAAATSSEIAAILNELMPLQNSAPVQTALNYQHIVSSLIQDRGAVYRGESSSADDDMRHKVWVKAVGQKAQQGVRQATAGYDMRLSGVSVGVERDDYWDNVLLGVSVSALDSVIDYHAVSDAEMDIRSGQFMVYGHYLLPRDLWLSGYVGYGYSAHDTARVIGSDRITGNYGMHSYYTSATAGLDYITRDGLVISPKVSLLYSFLDSGEYQESGTLALNVSGQQVHVLEAGVGGNIKKRFEWDSGATIEPFLGASLRYNVLDRPQEISSTFVSAPDAGSFESVGQDGGAATFSLEAGMHLVSSDTLQVTSRYALDAKADYISHRAELRAGIRF